METQAANFRRELRDQYAIEALEVAKVYGVQIEYIDRDNENPIKLWAIPSEQERTLVKEDRTFEEHSTLTFHVPRQIGCSCLNTDCYLMGEYKHEMVILFPPKNKPSTNAIIRYEGHDWAIITWDCDSVEAKFALHAVRHQARRLDL